ncbi:MAG: N-acetyltransferase family protein, partial [Flavobacteriales bacterium]
MKKIIRKGIKKDLPSVLKLIKELADYENASDQVTITIDDLERDGFGTHPCYWFLVAEKDEEIIGLSFYWIRYSTWKGKFLFLEDFVVKQEYRKQGIGSLLFEETIN